MLYSERKRLRELAEREGQGENFWTSSFDQKVRQKIWYAFIESGQPDAVVAHARYLILKDEGLQYLIHGGVPLIDFQDYLMECPDEMMPTVVEAMFHALADLTNAVPGITRATAINFQGQVNSILEAHRVSFEFIDKEMVPFESKALHVTILQPALTLLNVPRFQKANQAYLEALNELTRGAPGDAITDAATALQEILVALGCQGDSLGPLLKSARNKGLLAAHDLTLTEAIQKTIDWVSADRSNMGDAHTADSAAIQDAWFTVHVVGALIVRLAGPARTVP